MLVGTRQRGAVLAVGLLMLLILTIIGVSAMKSTVLDEKIAANSQFKMMAFQAAESALKQFANINEVVTFLSSPDKANYEVGKPSYPVGKNGLTANVTVTLADAGFLPYTGASLGEGGSGLRMQVFEFTATATLGNTNAVAVHRLQVGRLVPAIEGQH